MLRNISTFRFQLPDFLSYHLRNARNGSLRTTYIISPPPPLPKKLAPSASFGPSHRWIASLHNKKPGYEPGDCMLLVMAFGRSIFMSRQLQSKLKSLSRCLVITHISYYKLPIGADDNDSNRFPHFISLSQQTSTAID